MTSLFSIFNEAPNFEKSFFRIPLFTLPVLNMEARPPGVGVSWQRKLLMAINMVLIVTLLSAEFKFFYEGITTDLSASLRTLCPCMTMSIGFIKLLYLMTYNDEYHDLMQNLKDYLISEVENPKKAHIVTTVAAKSLKYTFPFFIFTFATNLLFGLTPIVEYFRMHLFTDLNTTDIIIKQPIPISLPYIHSNLTNHNILRVTFYLMMLNSGNCTVFVMVAISGGFICFCLYLSAAQQTLQYDFKQIFVEYDHLEVFSLEDNNKIYNKLVELLHSHSRIMYLSTKLSDLYGPIMFSHFLFAAVSIGLTLLIFINLAEGFERNIYICYNISICTELYFLCSGAEYLNESLLDLAHLCYSCPWYKCNARLRKLITLIMMGAQRGCRINVPFFQPSLPMFQAVMRTAGSYITLLKTFL